MPKQLNELARNTGVRLTLNNLFKEPCRKTGCLCIRAGGRSKPGVAGAAFEHPLERVAEDPARKQARDCFATFAMTILSRGWSEGDSSPFIISCEISSI
jgi:hypothetical protein